MPKILDVWILNEKGEAVFSYNHPASDTGEIDSGLYSDLVMSIQSFSKHLGEKAVERIEMGDAKIFILKNNETNLLFIVKGAQEANNKKVEKFLRKIQEVFLQNFKADLEKYDLTHLRVICKIFKTYVDKLLEEIIKKRMSSFLDSM